MHSKAPEQFALLEWMIKALGLTFLALGVLKVHGLMFGRDRVEAIYLAFPNPIFSLIANRSVLSLAAFTEIAVGWVAFRGRGLCRASLLLWFSCAALLYKVALIYIRYSNCSGLTDPLGALRE